MSDPTIPPVRPTPRAYPVPRPEDITSQPYVSFGCLLDLGEALIAHGFPRPQGYDFVALRNAAEWFLYDSWDPDEGARDLAMPSDPPPLPPGVEGGALGTRHPHGKERGERDA